MEQTLTTAFDKMLDYGLFAALAIAVIAGGAWIMKYMVKRMADQGDRYLTTLEAVTSVMAKIATKVGVSDDAKN